MVRSDFLPGHSPVHPYWKYCLVSILLNLSAFFADIDWCKSANMCIHWTAEVLIKFLP